MTKDNDTPRKLVWLDLETTGSNERDDFILEIGAFKTNEHGQILDDDEHGGTFSVTLFSEEIYRGVLYAEPIVRKMHNDSGLFQQAWNEGISPAQAKEKFEKWLRKGKGQEKWLLAGSGVGHFDRRFLDVFLEGRYEKWFHYGPVDVGMLRRSFDLWGMSKAFETESAAGDKPHRGLDDALLHRNEWTQYRDRLDSLLDKEALFDDLLSHLDYPAFAVKEAFKKAAAWDMAREKMPEDQQIALGLIEREAIHQLEAE